MINTLLCISILGPLLFIGLWYWQDQVQMAKDGEAFLERYKQRQQDLLDFQAQRSSDNQQPLNTQDQTTPSELNDDAVTPHHEVE